MSIVIKNLSYKYPNIGEESYALKDISFTIDEGSFFGIIGHTGSGKTTLVQHLNGLIPSESGCVTIDGHDVSDKKQRPAVRSLVGMVFQYPEYQLFSETVYEDVAFGPRNMHLSEEEIDKRVLYAMEIVGLDPSVFRDKSPFELSGGEKRRAALAGVLAMKPKYLVLDEPMAGLDPLGRRDILQILERFRSEESSSIIMISHSMEDIARHATQLLVLHKGSIAFLDTPEKVFSHAEELHLMGLSVPQVTVLSDLLRNKGFQDVPVVSGNEQPLFDWIKRRYSHD